MGNFWKVGSFWCGKEAASGGGGGQAIYEKYFFFLRPTLDSDRSCLQVDEGGGSVKNMPVEKYHWEKPPWEKYPWEKYPWE